MTADETKITVAHLVATLDRIDQWLGAVKKGLEALPQDQEIAVDTGDAEALLTVPQPHKDFQC
ncbi:MAG: hypothetical protein ABFS37_09085 [Acidobacteriota bacterium]